MADQAAQQRERPRKLPRQSRSAETVAAIVEVAARILERDGPDGFTTNAVAERAGVSIGSLYQYFPSKAALIGALIVRETSLLIAEWDDALIEGDGPTALHRLIDSAIGHQLGRPILARVLDLEEARFPLDEDRRHVMSRLAAILAEVIDRRDLPTQPDAAVAAQDVLAIIRGMVDAAGEGREEDREALGTRVRRAVFGYLHDTGQRTGADL